MQLNHYRLPGYILALVVLSCVASLAAVDLALHPQSSVVRVGQTVSLGLYAFSDTTANWPISAVDVVISHSPADMKYTGLSGTGAYPWMSFGLPTSAPGDINKKTNDGSFMYVAWANLGTTAPVPPTGLLVTTLLFQPQVVSGLTEVSILPVYGATAAYTKVYDGSVPGLDVTGNLGSARFLVLPANGLTSVTEVKAKSDGTAVTVGGPVVTVSHGSVFYIQDQTGFAGIRVNRSSDTQSLTGSVPIVSGTLRTIDGERTIDAATALPGGAGTAPRALGMAVRSIELSPSPIACLTRLWGRVESPNAGSSEFTLRGASGSAVRVRLSGVGVPASGAFVVVTGVLGRDSGGLAVWVDKPVQVAAP